MHVRSSKKRRPRLEVFPQIIAILGYADGSEGDERKYYVRLRSVNGGKLLTSDPYDNDSNAIRAAKSINTSVAEGRLDIVLLDEKGKIIRTYERKTP